MTLFGMARKANGIWEVKQLYPYLQEIVSKYAEPFNWISLPDSLAIDGEVSESDSETDYGSKTYVLGTHTT